MAMSFDFDIDLQSSSLLAEIVDEMKNRYGAVGEHAQLFAPQVDESANAVALDADDR